MFLQLCDIVENQARVTAEAVQLEHQELIKLRSASVFQKANSPCAHLQRNRSRYAIVGVHLVHGQLMQLTIPDCKLPLRGNRLPLALFFGRDPDVDANRHQHTFLTRGGSKGKSLREPSRPLAGSSAGIFPTGGLTSS